MRRLTRRSRCTPWSLACTHAYQYAYSAAIYMCTSCICHVYIHESGDTGLNASFLQVYTWGDSREGQLGHGDETSLCCPVSFFNMLRQCFSLQIPGVCLCLCLCLSGSGHTCTMLHLFRNRTNCYACVCMYFHACMCAAVRPPRRVRYV